MRIAIVTDAWYPQQNGVVRVIDSVVRRLGARGHEVLLVTPEGFRTVPCPGYPEIPLSLFPGRMVARRLADFAPEAVHLATEGPLGQAARKYCLKRGWPFTSAYHSKFPEYINVRTRAPLDWLYGIMRRFHAPSKAVLCPSHSVFEELRARGFETATPWSHGVDIDVFRPLGKDGLSARIADLPRPVHLYVGRVTVDKNLSGFLDLALPGSKVVVGEGPQRDALIRRYPQAHFLIADGDAELARFYSAADVFVFPSLTDTFGLVMLESLACGVPVAAFPVTGPRDVIGRSGAGALDEDLAVAVERARAIPPETCRAHAATFSWDVVADELLSALAPIKGTNEPAAAE